jgi:hypothetical protein
MGRPCDSQMGNALPPTGSCESRHAAGLACGRPAGFLMTLWAPIYIYIPQNEYSLSASPEASMNEDNFNTSIRKFLKVVGVTSQREIEKAVRAAIEEGKLTGNEKLPAKMTLTVEGAAIDFTVDGTIELA